MAREERFDRSPPNDLHKCNERVLSRRLLQGLLFLGTWTLTQEALPHGSKTKSHLTTSWVEEDYPRFGYHIALSRVAEIPRHHGHFILAAAFTKVDREATSIVEGPTLIFANSIDDNIEPQAEAIRTDFNNDREHLEISIKMLGKIIHAMHHKDFGGADLDHKVKMGLHDDEETSQHLAENFPTRFQR